MPKFLRGRRPKFEKLSEKELKHNSTLLEKCGRKKVPVPGRTKFRLKECAHNEKAELEIPSWNCLDCIWEKMPTDDEYEYDPNKDEYDDDWYGEAK